MACTAARPPEIVPMISMSGSCRSSRSSTTRQTDWSSAMRVRMDRPGFVAAPSNARPGSAGAEDKAALAGDDASQAGDSGLICMKQIFAARRAKHNSPDYGEWGERLRNLSFLHWEEAIGN